MIKNKEGGESKEGFRMFGAFLPYLPSLMIRLGASFLRLKLDAKKAGKTFHKELMRQGIDKEKADEFTQMYLETSNMKNYMGLFR